MGMAVSGSRGAQNPPTAPNRHVFSQSDFGRHGESQFHDRAFWERRLGVKENSTATQVLSKSGHSPSIEVNRQRQVHFETLRASAFKTMFQTIRICAHLPPSSFPRSSSRIGGILTLSRIEPAGKFQIAHVSELWKSSCTVGSRRATADWQRAK
jgi:hypothetical protein